MVRLILKATAELNAKSQEKLSQVVQTAFSQCRKMLRNTMKSLLSEAAFEELGIDPKLRAEDVPVEDYVRIANYLS